MKRSEINTIMGSADQFIRSRGFYLPPFAYWKPEEWRSKGPEVHEIVANHLGWDITDFGKGDFTNYGLFLFTLRNGSPSNWKTLRGKLYAEKIMIVEENQYTPDNRFNPPVGRFPTIEEDEEPLFLLCNDYRSYYRV